MARMEIEDIRAARPYLLSVSPLQTFARRLVSIAALVALDLGGLVAGLYLALALRALVRDPNPAYGHRLWGQETDWLPFLALLLLLEFSRNRLYAPREIREGAGRIVPSVLLVAMLSLAFAIGTGQHFTTFGLYPVAAVFVAALISLLRWSYELVTGRLMRSLGVRRRALIVGEPEHIAHLRDHAAEQRIFRVELLGDEDDARHQYAPRRANTAGSVFRRIVMSSQSDQFSR